MTNIYKSKIRIIEDLSQEEIIQRRRNARKATLEQLDLKTARALKNLEELSRILFPNKH